MLSFIISKKPRFYHILAILFFLPLGHASAQKIKAAKGSFGVDNTHKIIVWHQPDIDSFSRSVDKIKSFRFNKTFKLEDSLHALSYSKAYKLRNKGKSYSLYISNLPIVHLQVDTIINKNSKVLGYYTYYNATNYIKSSIGIEYRGNLSLTYPKKTYDLEFWNDSIRNNSKDVKFKDLRNDDDWILDGLYNEPLRIRSYLANNLWSAIHTPHYQMAAPAAKSGIDLELVEVFKNQQYQGIYALSESVDRKLLQLKRNKDQIINGELFKASSYEGAPAFEKAPDYENLFPHWGGFEMIYPILDYKSHWEDLYALVNLVVHSTDKEFALNIGKKFNIDNAIDYYLFINLLRATDNLGKNYYIARYDSQSEYFFVPWDLDGVMGIIQDGKRIATYDDILSNGLFDRLLKVNPNDYRNKLKKRWKVLRKTEFSEEKLFHTMEKLYSKLLSEKLYEREQLIWPTEKAFEAHYSYLETWLKKRLTYLDAYFTGL